MRDKQIEEMVKHCHFYEDGNCILCEELWVECDAKCDMCEFAKQLYNAGYRKASDVALEVIREVIGIFRISDSKKHIDLRSETERWSFDKEKFRKGIAELKKKYESEGEG